MRNAPRAAGLAWLTAAALHALVPRDAPLVQPPSPAVWLGLSVGRTTTAAHASWSAAVLHRAVADRPDPMAFADAAHAAFALDPGLRPPAAHGALMLRELGRHDLAEDLLDRAMERWPDDPWFPWLRGMIAWVDRSDRAGAAGWLERASRVGCPSCAADDVHGRAARGLREGAP